MFKHIVVRIWKGWKVWFESICYKHMVGKAGPIKALCTLQVNENDNLLNSYHAIYCLYAV